MTTARPRVIVTRRLPDPVEDALRASFDVRLNPRDRQFTPADLREAMLHCDGLLCTLTDQLTGDLFTAPISPCRILANFGVGVNHIALDAARQAGLTVTNTPEVLTECTADLTIALMLMTLRRLGEGERELRAGSWTGWRPTHLLGHRVSGRTLGVIGLGRIGEAVARRASHGLGMRVMVWGPRRPSRERLAAAGASASDSLEQLLTEVDIVSLHCPLTEETDRLMDRRRLHLMKRGAVLINTARGEIVDEEALVDALRSGQLGGAGLDVYAREPQVPAGLLDAPGVVLLPHLGSATVETRTAMGLRAVENLRAFFAGEPPPDRVA